MKRPLVALLITALLLSGCAAIKSTVGYADQLFAGANAAWTQYGSKITKAEFEAVLKSFGVTDPTAISTIESKLGFVGETFTFTYDAIHALDTYLNGK